MRRRTSTLETLRLNFVPGLGVHPLNEDFEFGRFNAPLSAAANLDGWQVAAAYQGVGLCCRDVECLGDVGEGEEALSHALIVPRSQRQRTISTGALHMMPKGRNMVI